MDWLQIITGQHQQSTHKLKKIQKITLYDHNYLFNIDEANHSFHAQLNCKRLNRLYSTICDIHGDLLAGQININCRLLDQQRLVGGQWTYQRIELTRFAFHYNERSFRNIFIRVHPLSGAVCVTLSFLTGASLFEEEQKLRQTINDLCHLLGEQSQMIFNTLLQIILGRQANEPYLKSALKVNPGFPRYMKVDKLLQKIKSLIATSSFYKIRSDISSSHKNRSYFKKIYLREEKKLENNFKIQQMALAYQIKFHSKYELTEKKNRDKQQLFIKDYIELEEKNQIEFAKHLNQGAESQYLQPALNKIALININLDANTQLYQLQISQNECIYARGEKLSAVDFAHEIAMLQAIGKRHPNMSEYFIPYPCSKELEGWVFYRWEQQISVCDYLRRNSRTISLETKLHIITQICSFMQYLHKRNIGYFIEVDNIYITRGLEVRIRGFKASYQVVVWVDTKDKKEAQPLNFIISQTHLKLFPYRYILKEDLNNEKCDVLSLGVTLYRILMCKFPFEQSRLCHACSELSKDQWRRLWTVQTEYFRSKGGEIVKIIAHLLLKCVDIESIANRPYVEWLLVILCEVRTSLNGLY